MIYQISNNILTVDVNSLGAHLYSIRSEKAEYLWNGDTKYWHNRAPLLFPLVGTIPNNTIKIKGKEYHMVQHGFLKELEFTQVENTGSEMVLEAMYSEETLKKYPFKFKVTIKFSVEGNKFNQLYTVQNLDDSTMTYGFGLHPGFNTEGFGYKFDECCIDFNEDIKINRPSNVDGFQWDFTNRVNIPTHDGVMDFSEEVFKTKPIVLDNLKSKKVSLKSKTGELLLNFYHENFNFFAFWHADNSPIICFEPWASHNAFLPVGENLEDNLTMEKLEPNCKSDYFVCVEIPSLK